MTSLSAAVWPPSPPAQPAGRWRRIGVMAFWRRPHGLRLTMAVLVLAALIPPLALQTVSAVHGIHLLGEAHKAELASTVESHALTIRDEIDRVISAARVLAGMQEAGDDADAFTRNARVFEAVMRTPAVLWRGPGELIASAPNAGGVANAAVAEGIRDSAQGHRVVVIGGGIDRIWMFIPVSMGMAPSVLQLSLDTEHLETLLSHHGGSPDIRLALAGPGGVLLSPGHAVDELAGATLPDSGIVHFAGQPALLASAPISNAPGFRVVGLEPEARYLAATRAPFDLVIAVSLLSVIVAATIAVLIGARLTRPLQRLSEAALAISGGQALVDDVPPSKVTEFNALHESLRKAERVVRRRAAAERLAVTEARTGHELLASVVNATADQILVKDLDLRYVLANRATLLEPFMARSEWQVLGRRAIDIEGVQDAEAAEKLDREVLATGDVRRRQFEWTRADGKLATFVVTKTPWRNAAGEIAGVVTVIHDITESRRAEQRLAAVQGELLRASRLSAMGAMASGLAHELNQPLAAATNFLNAANRLLSRTPSEARLLELARHAVVDAAGQTLRAGAIVRRLREFVGRGEADLKLDDVAAVISEVCDVARADRATRASELSLRLPAEPLAALVDRTQVQQVLLNLIRNAAEAIDDAPGGRIKVVAGATPGHIEITVSDNGPGLSPEIVDRLFQPFVSTKALGMGIGLAICRTIIEGHGGTLTAGASPEGGACFRILLPTAATLYHQPETERSEE